MMNEQFNPFRTVPREEVERDHTFRSLRHFPEISKSIPSTTTCIQTREAEISALNKTLTRNTKSKKTTLKSTHYLESLCKSSLDEFNTLSTFRKQIINDREKQFTTKKRSLKKTTSLNPLETGNAKLAKLAIKHDSRSANNDLQGFHGFSLSKEEFDYQLKHCLSIYFTRDELDAVFEKMDADRSDRIDGVEFLRYFFKLGQESRNRVRTDLIETAAKGNERKQEVEKEERQRIEEENLKFDLEYSPFDLGSSMRKVCKFVAKTNLTLDSIEFRDISSFLTPLEFKVIIEKLTNDRFRDGEIAALLDKYGDPIPSKQIKNGVWCVVDGTNLIKNLIALRKQEIEKEKQRALANSQSREKILDSLGKVDLFPKCLGR